MTTLLVGYPILVAASGLWWRVWLVWMTTAMAMLAYIWLYLDAAISWRDGRLHWNPSPDLEHSNIFVAGVLLIGYVVARAGQANSAAEPVLRTAAECVIVQRALRHKFA